MPKTWEIKLDVEELALGAVLRKLNEMPGIAALHLDLGRGGEGAGRKQLDQASVATPRGNNSQEIVKLLMSGPKHLDEMVSAIGGKKSSFYTATSKLSKEGLVERGANKGQWQLTAKARGQLGGAVPALAAPKESKVKEAPSGRAVPGSGNIALKAILLEGPKSPSEVRAAAGAAGISPKSITGVLDRAKKAGLIRKNGSGYELTAKGQKIETTTEAAHG